MIDVFLAALCDIGGIGILYASWRGYCSRRWAIPTGWLLLGISCAFWMRGAGGEFGITYAFLGVAVCAWFIVGLSFRARGLKPEKNRTSSLNLLPSKQAVLQNLLLFIMAVPLAGWAAILLSVVLVHQLPWVDVNALVTGIILMPIIWGLMSYWVCADSKSLRPGLALLCCGLLCAFYIYG